MLSEKNANVGTGRSGKRIHMLLLGFIVGRESREAKSIVKFIKDLAISRGEWREWLEYVGQPYMLEIGEVEEAERYYNGLASSEEESDGSALMDMISHIIQSPAVDQLCGVSISDDKLILVFDL